MAYDATTQEVRQRGIIRGVDIRVLYLKDCPSWSNAVDRLNLALTQLGSPDTVVTLVQVDSEADCAEPRFCGSPTILVDEHDLFPVAAVPAGSACRLYPSADGLAGSPTIEALVSALTRRGVANDHDGA